jgi:putative transposase
MILDTSALLAILLQAPDAERFSAAICDAPRRMLSGVSFPEASIVIRPQIREIHTKAGHLAVRQRAEGLTVFALPAAHRRRLRTSNLLERLNKEIKRRTRVATLFPNEAALLRLVSAVLMEISEAWETEKFTYEWKTVA